MLDKEHDFTIQRQTIIYTQNIHLIDYFKIQSTCEAKNYNKQTKKSSLWLTWARQKNEIKELNHRSSSPGLGSTRND